jgi:alkane 1-monooxygenase
MTGSKHRAILARALPYLCIFIYPASVILGYGNGYCGILLTPITGAMLAYLDRTLPPLADRPDDLDPLGYPLVRSIVRFYVFGQIALAIWATWLYAYQPLDLIERIGLIASVGTTVGAVGGSLAHELIHGKRSIDRYLGMALLGCYNYIHFKIAHLEEHHRQYATPEDPGTARFGENIYQFYLRVVPGELRAVWQLEAHRLRRRNLSLYSHHNRLIRYLAVEGGILLAIYYAAGSLGVEFFLLQGAIALLHSQTASYIQHYGLERPRQGNGKYAPASHHYSWNSSHPLTNWCFLNLGKHGDHHVEPNKPYYSLDNPADLPQLPRGYFDMGFMALIPPLWFFAMNDRVQAWYANDPDAHLRTDLPAGVLRADDRAVG